MSFMTNVDIRNGEYGVWEYDSKAKAKVFKPIGKAVVVDSITENIETGAVELNVSFDYIGQTKHQTISRKTLSDPALLHELADIGADVTKKSFNVFVDSIRLQELEMEALGVGTHKVYEHLGWKTIQVPNGIGGVVNKICYRAGSIVGQYSADYIGPLKVKPMGDFHSWKSMVEAEIIGHTPAEVVMLCGLSAVINGLISSQTTGENSIIHLNGLTGSGKSTLAMAAASAYGEPFDGERRVYDASGTPCSQISIYGSWSATENATLGRCAGNRGSLIVLNELGKFKGADMTSIVYNLSEGTDKLRMGKDLGIRQMEGYSTTILSVGEHSLLDRCQSKADGLRVRVLELDMPMTTSAENADRIKAVVRRNNGHAAPMMAEYIINNGGIKMVLEIYDRWRSELLAVWPDTPSRERFVSKFPALFLTTAELAKAALGIAFSAQDIVEFFLEYEGRHSSDRNSAADSYELIITQCEVNAHKFYIKNDKSYTGGRAYQEQTTAPRGECWGRITNMLQPFTGDRVIVQELEIHKNIVEQLLRDNGFSNKKTCIEAWKSMGVLDYEDDTHPCRKRKIDPQAPEGTKDKVFVFRRFCAVEDLEGNLETIRKREEQQKKTKSKLVCMQNRLALLTEGGDEDDEAVNPA